MAFNRRPRYSGAARIARLSAILAVPLLVLTGLGHRYGIVTPGAVVPLITLGYGLALIATTGAILALIWIWVTAERGVGLAVSAIFLSIPGLVLLGLFVYGMYRYPTMNDISTEIDHPLLFWSQAQPPSANRAAVDRVAQAAAYPQVSARVYPAGVERVFSEIETAVRRKRWDVELRVPPLGPGGFARIEATAKTLLFGFPDHIAIHATAGLDGTRVDMRSASHMGRHDVGQNARRITGFFAALDKLLQGVQEETDQPAEALEASS